MTTTTPLLSIYDGQACIGFVIARGRHGYETFTAGERSLGVFEAQTGAINKIQSIANEEASVA
jgi:hypothetical protein